MQDTHDQGTAGRSGRWRRLGGRALGVLALAAVALVAVLCTRAVDRLHSGVDALAQLEPEIIEERPTLDSFTVRQLLTPLSQLTTLQYSYQDVELYENSRQLFGMELPFTQQQILYTYSGTVHAGVDLAALEITVDEAERTIHVQLPQPAILAHEIDEDSFAFYTVKDSLFTRVQLEQFTAQIADLKAEKERQLALDGDFYTQVLDNAQQVIAGLLGAADSTRAYRVAFIRPETPHIATERPGGNSVESGESGDGATGGDSVESVESGESKPFPAPVDSESASTPAESAKSDAP